MLIPISAIRITDATSTAHLDKVERGYENMDHFHVEFKKVGQALRSIDFIQGKGSTESAPPPHARILIFTYLPICRGGRGRRRGRRGRRRGRGRGPDGFRRQRRSNCFPPTSRAPTDEPFNCHQRHFKLAFSSNIDDTCKRISHLSFISGQFLPLPNLGDKLLRQFSASLFILYIFCYIFNTLNDSKTR